MVMIKKEYIVPKINVTRVDMESALLAESDFHHSETAVSYTHLRAHET